MNGNNWIQQRVSDDDNGRAHGPHKQIEPADPDTSGAGEATTGEDNPGTTMPDTDVMPEEQYDDAGADDLAKEQSDVKKMA